jgi:ribosomal protein S18 acetylase RimI-like enzyme
MNHRLKRQANRCNLPNICKWILYALLSTPLTISTGLNMICTHPKYRRRGVAALMMQWGVTQANELELEMFVEASSDGTHLYRNFGFVEIEELSTPRPEGELDEEWKKLEEDYPFEATWMWRPKQGIQSKYCLE